jgi:hypothetical protein
MDKYFGLKTKVILIDKELGFVKVEIDGGKWLWANDWLVKLE